MTKFTKYRKPIIERPDAVHPVWRGIGCLLMIVVPVMAFAGAVTLVNYGIPARWPIPQELLGHVQFPNWVWNTVTLKDIAAAINRVDNPVADLVFFVVLLLLLSGIVSTAYAIIFRLIGPPRYTPLDVPPPRHKPKP